MMGGFVLFYGVVYGVELVGDVVLGGMVLSMVVLYIVGIGLGLVMCWYLLMLLCIVGGVIVLLGLGLFV